MEAKAWARCGDTVADILRRGAWYPILSDAENDGLVLAVRGRAVRFPRARLTVRHDPPTRWSIVVRTGVLRPTLGGEQGRDVVATYAVCPHCAYRQELMESDDRAPRLVCERCARDSEVDWRAPC